MCAQSVVPTSSLLDYQTAFNGTAYKVVCPTSKRDVAMSLPMARKLSRTYRLYDEWEDSEGLPAFAFVHEGLARRWVRALYRRMPKCRFEIWEISFFATQIAYPTFVPTLSYVQKMEQSVRWFWWDVIEPHAHGFVQEHYAPLVPAPLGTCAIWGVLRFNRNVD